MYGGFAYNVAWEETLSRFEWTRAEVLGLAKETCTHCLGFGMRDNDNTGAPSPCNCVLRAIFRACYHRFRYLAETERHMSRTRVEHTDGKEQRLAWGRRDEEYIADFCIVARRNLTAGEHRLFRFHYLLGADWKLCCRQLKMDRGNFFHEVYRIQEKLGRVLRELRPYSLFPLDEYFGGAVRGTPPRRTPTVIEMPVLKRRRLDPPLRKVA
jgi:hypothetical protein